jgi:hypothetical protein
VKLDDVRVAVRPGDGIVARLPGVVLVVPFAANGQVDPMALDRLLDECGKGPVGGRLDDLRRVADGGVPSFALVGEVGDGLAVFVSGDVDAAIAGGEPVLRLSGGDLQGWTVRVPEGFATLDVGRPDPAPVDSRLDLRAGVVTGAGVVLSPASAMAVPATPGRTVMPAMAATPASAAMTAAAAPMNAAAGQAPTAAPLKATRRKRAKPEVAPAAVAAAPAPAPARVAAPPVVPAAPPVPAAEAGPVEVWGIRCKKGHFNDPEARYCGICGIHMVQDKVPRVKGPRPVLGFLVLDDGTSFKLDTDYVLGSDPHGHEAVTSGMARPLVVRAEGDVISPVHARIILKDWDVFLSDCGSVYGTYVWSPGGTEWERLTGDQMVKLGAGSQVLVAQRGFMFQPVNKR